MSAEEMPPHRAVEQTAAPPPARLGRALRAGFRLAWDRLGLVLALSLTWSLLVFVPLTLWHLLPASLPILAREGLAALLAALTLSAPVAGAFLAAHLACVGEEVSYLDFWRGAKSLFGPATRLGLIHLVVWSVLAINLWFYLHVGHLLGGVAALLCLYVLLFWGLMAVYHFPLLVAQETGVFDEPDRCARRGALAVLRRAFYLALGSPFYSAGLLAVTLLLSAVLLGTVALSPLLWLGLIALITTQATHTLLIQYSVLPPPPTGEAVPDGQFRIQEKDKVLRQDQRD
jgi:uncharacterized membrane protein YesL